jgi:hypothetical protein
MCVVSRKTKKRIQKSWTLLPMVFDVYYTKVCQNPFLAVVVGFVVVLGRPKTLSLLIGPAI